MRIRLICEGKTRDAQLRALQAEYLKRLTRFTELAVEEIRPWRSATGARDGKLSAGERQLLVKLQDSTKILLDERGREWTSAEFAAWFGRQELRGARELVFLVGGPEGFSAPFREQADSLLALSRMTLTHDWARTLLLEQIYRAFTILRGHPYPR
jgi:23S rRNA (pseudouridine1915-N3)-methyltransferase